VQLIIYNCRPPSDSAETKPHSKQINRIHTTTPLDRSRSTNLTIQERTRHLQHPLDPPLSSSLENRQFIDKTRLDPTLSPPGFH
jgi:hypothetical protein